MKGFKDPSGKFHPITDYKGVRKSRVQSTKTLGVKVRKARSGHKCYFCNSKDTSYCGFCGEYLCSKHAKNIPKRLEGMVAERMKRYKFVEMAPQEVLSLEIITDVEDNFTKILRRTAKNKACFFVDGNLMRPDVVAERHGSKKGQIEEFCGAVTDQLEKFIWRKYGKKAGCAEQGQYNGEGAENSTDFNQIEKTVKHEWFRLADGTIIDGAGGQFVDERKTVKNEDRLRIIFSDDPRQNWYNPDSKICDLCGGRLMGGKCPSTDVHRAMALVKAGVPIEEARRQVGLR